MPKRKTLNDYLGGVRAYATRPGQRPVREVKRPREDFLRQAKRRRGPSRRYF
jgi:hypothetical protein